MNADGKCEFYPHRLPGGEYVMQCACGNREVSK